MVGRGSCDEWGPGTGRTEVRAEGLRTSEEAAAAVQEVAGTRVVARTRVVATGPRARREKRRQVE